MSFHHAYHKAKTYGGLPGAVLLFLLVLLTFSATPAIAADFELTINGGTATNPPSLGQAVTDINTAGVGGAGQYQEEVELIINTDVVETADTAGGLDPLYFIHGAPSAANPTAVGANGGFKSVTISGGTGDRKVIGYDDDPAITTRNRVIEIINVSGTGSGITLKNLEITGGNLTDTTLPTNETYLGGGGLYLGAASGSTKYTTPGGYAETITLSNILVTKNSVDLAIDNTGGNEMRAAIGGGAFIDATNYATNRVGGNIAFTGASFTENSVTMSSSTANGGTGSSSFGGGYRIKNAAEFTHTGGEVSKNSVKTINGSHAAGGGIAIDDFTQKATLTNLTIKGNIAEVDGRGNITGPSKALGGGLYTLYHTTNHITKLELFVTGNNQYFTFSENQTIATGANADAYGGGAYLNGNTHATFTLVNFDKNTATSDAGEARGGAIGQGFHLTSTDAVLKITGSASGYYSLFTENKADGKTGAYGGALYVSSDSVIDTTGFSKNTATADEAAGGAIYNLGEITLDKTVFEENAATMKAGGTSAHGGALYSANDIAATDSSFSKNTATGSQAYGGAVYAGTDSSFTGGVMSENKAVGDNTTGTGLGGAIYGVGLVKLNTYNVTANEATGDTARGGAIYAVGNVELADTSLTGNKAVGTTTSEGGAVYMSTDVAGGGKLTLSASTDKTVSISGNLAGADSNSFHFGGNGTSNGVLEVKGDGAINLLDPMKVAMTGGTFTLDKTTGTGTLFWAGVNTFDAAGGSTLDLKSGTTMLSKDFQAVGAATGGDFTVNIDGTWGFDGSRYDDGVNPSVAMFDYTAVTGIKDFTIAGATNIDIDMSSELVDGTFKYLVADGYGAFADQTFTSAHLDSVLGNDGTADQIWLTTNYTSIYTGLINASDPNTKSAIATGKLPDLFRELDEDQRALLTSSTDVFDSVTPGWFMNHMSVGRSIITSGAETALRYGVGMGVITDPDHNETAMVSSERGLAYLAPSGFHNGPRFWAGYLGDFDRLDSNGGYHGYKSDRNGLVFGLNYDFGRASSIGIYGGYTKSKTKGKGVVAEVDSDVGHVGVIGRVSPFATLPRLSFLGDAGYTFGKNDTTRGVGGLTTTGEFDQKYYTVGLGAEYSARFGKAFVAPYASMRYIHLKQDSFTETGVMASTMDDMDEDAFTSRLGARFGFDIDTRAGVFTPSVDVAWRHEFGDRQFTTNAMYQGIPNPTVFRVKSTQTDRDSVEIGAAIRANFNMEDKKLGMNIGYNLNAGSNRTNHSVYVGFDLSF